jgi:branched-chain amino acid transport system substrate-binding protein
MREKRSYRWTRTRAVLLVALTAPAAVGAACDSSAIETEEREVLIGGLLPLTGEYASWGLASQAAMALAVEDVNVYLEGNAAGIRFASETEDVQVDPQLALEKAQALQARGVQILIGPPTSEQVAHLKPFVDSQGLLLVSPTSTAGSLAITGDNIFRFTPSDRMQGVAVSAMMWDDGIRVVVPIWRDDPSGAGLEAATRASFSARGGAVLDGVKYGTATEDYAATVAALRARTDQAIAEHGAERVGIYLVGFDEVVEIFARADADPVLGSVRWYGSDSTARLDALVNDSRAAAFAMRSGFPSSAFGMEEGARDIWEPVAARIRARTDQEADARALAVYDAVWVVARGYVASGATQDIERLKHAVTTAAASGYGATGWTALDEAGDRRHGDFDFWAIRMQDGAPRWTRVAMYESRMGRLVR